MKFKKKNLLWILPLMFIMLVSIANATVYMEDITHYYDFEDNTDGLEDQVGNIDWTKTGTITASTGAVGNGLSATWSTSNYLNIPDDILTNLDSFCLR